MTLYVQGVQTEEWEGFTGTWIGGGYCSVQHDC